MANPIDLDIKQDDYNVTIPSNIRNDGWGAVIKGLGGLRDSRTTASYLPPIVMYPQQLAPLYMDGLCKSIVDMVPELAFKNSPAGTIQNDPIEEFDEGLITREMNRLQMTTHFKTADKWRRLFGGSLLYIGAIGSGRPDTPLKPERVKTIEFLRVIPLTDIVTADSVFDTDINSPTYGRILKYKVRLRAGFQYTEAYLHHTRCIPFHGAPLPDDGNLPVEQRYWGGSILNFVYEDVRDYRIATGNVNLLLSEASVSVYKFQDLAEILSAPDGERRMQVRISAINQSKGAINGVILGTDEEFVRESVNFTGIADLIDRQMMQISAVTGIPVSQLFGRSPSGLNSTGGAEERVMLNLAMADQNTLTAEIQRLVDLYVVMLGLPKGDYSWKWSSLITLSEEQLAEQERRKAEAYRTTASGDQLYIQEGVLSPEDIYKLRFEDDLGKKSEDYFTTLGAEPEEETEGDDGITTEE